MLLSAHVERVSVSRMRFFFFKFFLSSHEVKTKPYTDLLLVPVIDREEPDGHKPRLPNRPPADQDDEENSGSVNLNVFVFNTDESLFL